MNPCPIYDVLNESDFRLCLSGDHLQAAQTGMPQRMDLDKYPLKLYENQKLFPYLNILLYILNVNGCFYCYNFQKLAQKHADEACPILD